MKTNANAGPERMPAWQARVVQPGLFVLVLAAAGVLGWCAAEWGLKVAGALLGSALLPALLIVGIVRAGRQQAGGLALLLTVALWALAAAGVWFVVTR